MSYIDHPTVSIIICTYNREDDLQACIDSIISQSFTDFEIIIVDGGSDKNIFTLIRKYINITIIHQKTKGGLSEARNIGIHNAKGDYIVFIDDDAVAEKGWLINLIKPLQDDLSISGVGGKVINYYTNKIEYINGLIRIDGKTILCKKEPQNFNYKSNILYNNLMGTNMAFRVSSIRSIGGFDVYYKYYLDESDISVRLIKNGFKIVHTPNAIVYHKNSDGPNRKSQWDKNWYIISKTTAYFTIKNFMSYNILLLTLLTFLSYIRRIFGFILFFIIGKVPVKILYKLLRDSSYGFVDGYKDGIRIRDSMNK